MRSGHIITGLLILLPAFSTPLPAFPPVPEEALNSITTTDLEAHLTLLAAPELEGRGNGQRGLQVAARYIASQLVRSGVAPGGDNGTYYQTFPLVRVGPLEDPNFLEIEESNGQVVARRFQTPSDFKPFHLTDNRRVTAPVVFAGYGITAPDLKYDDYEDIDAKNKIVLIMTHTPEERISTSDFVRDGNKSKYGSLSAKVENAERHGALAVLVVTDPNNFRPESSGERRHTLEPTGHPFPEKENPDRHRPKYFLPDDQPELVVVHVSQEIAEALVSAAGESLADLQTAIDNSRKPRSFEIKKRTVTVQTSYKAARVQVQNVVGRIGGAHTTAQQPVIICAHYDHDGIFGGQTYLGADDNASGTAAVMEIAEAFRLVEDQLTRPVWSVLFAAEEQGLLGSRYFTLYPPFAPDKTTAVLNLDMIGRNSHNEVYVIGSDFRSSELHALNEELAREQRLTLNFSQNSLRHYERLFFRSDQYHFGRLGIPVIFYTSGSHADYHQTSDTADKILPQKVQKIAQLAFAVAWRLATDTKPLKIDNDEGVEDLQKQ